MQRLQVWDSGKGSLCRVRLDPGDATTTFLQERLIEKNFLFVAVKRQMIAPSQPKHHVLLCHEIGKDGQTCDRVICVDLATPDNLTANGLFLGTDALYVNMGNRFLYKVKIIKDLHENTMDVLEVG